jgi:hypothetical protein
MFAVPETDKATQDEAKTEMSLLGNSRKRK